MYTELLQVAKAHAEHNMLALMSVPDCDLVATEAWYHKEWCSKTIHLRYSIKSTHRLQSKVLISLKKGLNDSIDS